jgi:transposase
MDQHSEITPHRKIVRAAGTAEEVATRRGVSVHTVRSWIKRDSIPGEYWLGFAEDGHATLEQLAAAAKRSA